MSLNAPSGVAIAPVLIALGAAGIFIPLVFAAIAPLALASHRHG